ncbi:MAG: phosphate ABC transporter ATP-binding protein [Oscillospiraceae bacterium]|nr:phosphate ABC transporter ATP-binding protein [Oscillospiraceae bacterium]
MDNIAIKINDVSCFYGKNAAVKNASIDIPSNSIYSFIGPSGCGKTTLLRSINRMNDLIESFNLTGSIEIDGENIYEYKTVKEIKALRKNIGMIFQQPNPLPTSIMKNMLLPIKEHYNGTHEFFRDKVIEKLKIAALYDEIEARLSKTALSLSGGQQQRLCIARALMLEPKIMLFDEPCSALDPIATFKIEEMLKELKSECTIIIVTHNMEQAQRISDYTAFFYQGEITEKGKTFDLFTHPKTELLYKYITGKF